ncbi:LPA3 [Symbiodinium sp. CCMP2592]|nr:LPA3 [Symbiodinium sp. CCMP2592]
MWPLTQAIPGCKTTYEVLKEGSGAVIQARSNATVHATGVVKESGKKFWSTKDPGQQPFSYQAGVGKVIKGWDQGCLGMKERKLIIPADEAAFNLTDSERDERQEGSLVSQAQNGVNEDAWPGPFEDVFIYIICQEAAELPKVRNYIEKADAVATRQGRVLRHVIFNLNLNKLRGDIEFYNKLLPFQPGQATPKVHLDFFSTFRNSYLIRFGKYTQTVLRDPFNISYVGAMYHAYPSPWQVFMQDPDGNYQPIHATDLRPSIQCVKRKLQRANGLWRDVGLPEDEDEDDVYKVVDMKAAGTINKTVLQFIKEGAGDALWWEEEFEDEVSRKWRLA